MFGRGVKQTLQEQLAANTKKSQIENAATVAEVTREAIAVVEKALLTHSQSSKLPKLHIKFDELFTKGPNPSAAVAKYKQMPDDEVFQVRKAVVAHLIEAKLKIIGDINVPDGMVVEWTVEATPVPAPVTGGVPPVVATTEVKTEEAKK